MLILEVNNIYDYFYKYWILKVFGLSQVDEHESVHTDKTVKEIMVPRTDIRNIFI